MLWIRIDEERWVVANPQQRAIGGVSIGGTVGVFGKAWLE
jgi:hypothetical protein